MKSIKNTETEKNLQIAFAGEAQAVCKYQFFAKKAKKEGFINVSLELEKIASQEQSHAKNFYKCFEGESVKILTTFETGKLGTTLENLNNALTNEINESNHMYPEFSEIAEKEGFPKIAILFKSIAVAERNHEKTLNKLINEVKEDITIERNEKTVWECIKCGYIYIGAKPPVKCPACSHGQEYFLKTLD